MSARFLLSVLVSTTILAAARTEETPRRPNVIVVITDDQGYGDFSCHGNPVLKTPNLDRLHAQSIRLTDFHVAPMCTPTRGQLMTGVDSLRNGAMNVSSGRTLLRRGIPTLANLFAAAGYRTGLFGKWHLGDNYPYRPQDRGFQRAVWFPSSHVGSAPDFWNNCYFGDTYQTEAGPRHFDGYCTDVFFREAGDWIGRAAKEKQPFFAYLATNAPHGPLFVPAKVRELYKGQPPNVARFFGMIANIDDNLAALDALLAKNGLVDNTIFVFLTDNGGTVGVQVHNAGMRGRKIDLYEGGHRVPCFVCWPAGKLRPPGDVAELTTVQDLAPTLLELCGIRPTTTFDGVSMAPLLRGQTNSLADRKLVIQFSRMNAPRPEKGDASVLWKRWRLVQDKELYDLTKDPAQERNVIAEHTDVAAQLRKHYDAWWAQIAPKVNDHEAIVVGSDAENPSRLSPADWEDSFLDQGQQVRAGLRRNGAWNIEAAAAGEYSFELRRWPPEAKAPIRAGLPSMKHADGVFSPGIALPIARARIRVGGYERAGDVTAIAEAVTFSTKLPAGRTQLQTWFLDGEGREVCGAYYVIVRRMREAASRRVHPGGHAPRVVGAWPPG